MSDDARCFKGVWIPASVWNHPNLNWFEKCLIAEIDSLCGSGRPSCASVEFFVERMGMAESTIKNTLSKLCLLGIVKRLKSDGRSTYRCVAPDYSSDPKQSAEWLAIDLRGTKISTSEVSNSVSPIKRVPKGERERASLSRFAKPASEETVVAYCVERGLPQKDGTYMWNHWKANGFTNNGRPIRDWKAEIRAWQTGGFFPSMRQVHRNGGLTQEQKERNF
jgi:hypothetical protein